MAQAVMRSRPEPHHLLELGLIAVPGHDIVARQRQPGLGQSLAEMCWRPAMLITGASAVNRISDGCTKS